MADSTISILIADDHTVVRKGLRSLLSGEKYGIEVIGEASNGQEAVQKAEQLKPDVILMDLVMPEKNGIEAIQEIKEIQPDARILVLTSFADDENVTGAIEAGAYGFLLKDTSPDELVQTIHSVFKDKLIIPQEFTQILLAAKRSENEKDAKNSLLTPREIDVLRCVAQGKSNKQIAQTLFISTATVRSHVSSVINKLDLENRTQLAIYAKDQGLI
jgi:NarL family two-component system response regulator LiaR